MATAGDQLLAKQRYYAAKLAFERNQAHIQSILNGMMVFRWVTFLLYFAFTVSLYVGDFMNLKSLTDSFLGSFIGFGLYLAIAFGLAFSLAKFKHNFYVHRGLYGGWVGMIFIVIVMGLVAEVFQSAGQQDVKARLGAANSAQYQDTLNSTSSLSSAYIDPYTNQLLELEGKLAQYQELERTCKNTCAQQRQRVESTEAKIAALKTLQQESAAKHSADLAAGDERRNQRLDQIEEKHYNPTIRSLNEMTGLGISTAVTLITGLISIIFEICHMYYSYMYNHATRAVTHLEDAMHQTMAHYINAGGQEADLTGHPTYPTESAPATRPNLTQPDRTPDLKTTPLSGAVSAFAGNPTDLNSPTLSTPPTGALEKIATGLDQAQRARDELHRNMAHTADQISKAWDDATSYPAKQDGKPILGTKEQQLRIPEVSTFGAELAAAGIPYPHDPVLDKAADKASIQRILGRVKPDLTEVPYPTALPDRSGIPHSSHPTGRVSDEPTDPTETEVRLKNAQAEIEQLRAEKLASEQVMQAEKERAEQARADAERQRKQAELKAKLQAEHAIREAKAAAERLAQAQLAEQLRAQREKEAKEQADRLERERAEAAHRAQLEADRMAREKVEADRMAQEEADRIARERTEALGRLTEEQVILAAQVIHRAIQSGQVDTLGFESLKEPIKAAGLPTASDTVRRLIRLGCQQLAQAGVVKLNDDHRKGKPLYVII